MSLIEKETFEDVTQWLLSNKALKGTPEYNEKASLFMSLREGGKAPVGETKEELYDWLVNNKDKQNTSEYKVKAKKFIDLSKRGSEISETPEEQEVSAGAAYRRGIIQGATFEFYDEIKAAALAAADYLTDNPSDQSFSQLYDTLKAREDELLNRYKEQQTGAYIGGQVTGGVATIPLGGLFGKAGQFLFGVGTRGATAGQTALRAGTAGAAQSGLAGFGMGEDLESRFKGAALGIGAGGVIGGGLGAGGYKLAEKVANSSAGLVNRTAGLGAQPRSTVDLSEELLPQLNLIADQANKARNAAYTSWRDRLEGVIEKTGKKFFRDSTEDKAPQVIPTKALKSLVDGMQSLVTDQKNINAILQESDNVSIDTYRNLYKTAWDLQKQLAKNKAVPFAKKLQDLEGFEYRHLDSLFPKQKLGTVRKELDNAVKNFETGQLLNKELVQKIARGEALEPTFAKQFLPNNAASYDKFIALRTRVNAWAKEAGVSPKQVDEILAPLRANALSDAINNPKLLAALGQKGTSEQLTLLKHYKEMLTPEQFNFINKLSQMPTNHLKNRLRSLLDYYSSTAVLGAVGVGTAAGVAGSGAGLAVLGLYLASPALVNSIAKNKQLLALATKVISAPTDVPPKELMRLTNSLGKAALKAGIITPSSAIQTLNSLQQGKEAEAAENR